MNFTAKPLFDKNKIRNPAIKRTVFINNKPSPKTVTAPVSELNRVADYKKRLNASAAKIKQLHNDLTTNYITLLQKYVMNHRENVTSL